MKNKTFIYEPPCGCTIAEACKEAYAHAILKKCLVEFNFNGVKIIADKDSIPHNLVTEYHAELDRKYREHQASLEGRFAAARQEVKVLAKQEMVNELINWLYSYSENKASMNIIIRFIREFAEIADDINVKFDHEKLYIWFVENGFEENWGLNQPKEFYTTRSNMGRYIIGQVMDCLKIKMPPHPCCMRFCEDYFKIKE